MKKIILAGIILSTLSSFAFENDPGPAITTGVISSPSLLVAAIIQSPTYSTMLSIDQRETIKAVRDDAIDYLSDQIMTEKLKETIENVRQAVKPLSEASDEEIAGAIVAIE